MSENPPRTASPETATSAAMKQEAALIDKNIAARRARLQELDAQARRPGSNDKIEKEYLKVEDEIRTAEKARNEAEARAKDRSRMEEIRARLDKLNRESIGHNIHHDKIEAEVDALEKELRGLELKGKPVKTGEQEQTPEPTEAKTPEPAVYRNVREESVKKQAETEAEKFGNTEDLVAHAREEAEARLQTLEEEESGEIPESKAAPQPEVSPDEDSSDELPLQPSAEMNMALDKEEWHESFDGLPLADRTPSEWREELRGIAGELEKLEKKFGVSGQGESLKVYIENRSKELEGESEKVGPKIQGLLDSIGKKYAKLGPKARASVVAGFVVGATAATFWSLFSQAPGGEAPQPVAEAKVEAPARMVTGKIPSPRAMADTAAKKAPVQPDKPEAAASGAPASVADIPKVYANADTFLASTEVSKGQGYEYMIKQLWRQLQEKRLDPAKYPEGSDLRALIEANKENIDEIVHKIAMKPEHKFFQEGVSTRVESDMHLTIEEDGEIHVLQRGKSFTQAPTPPQLIPGIHHDEPAAPVAEAPASRSAEAVPLVPVDRTPVTDSQDEPVHTGSYEESAAPTPETSHVEHPQAEQPPAPPSIEHTDSFINGFGVTIDSNVPALYKVEAPGGVTQFIAYGGSDEERFSMIQEYLINAKGQDVQVRWAHTVPSVFGNSIRIEDLSPAPKDVPAPFIVHSSFFQPKMPDPDTFRELVKTVKK